MSASEILKCTNCGASGDHLNPKHSAEAEVYVCECDVCAFRDTYIMPELTYKIVRFTFDENHPDHKRVMQTGLTLEEAQAWCHRDDTNGEGWFDGYDEE